MFDSGKSFHVKLQFTVMTDVTTKFRQLKTFQINQITSVNGVKPGLCWAVCCVKLSRLQMRSVSGSRWVKVGRFVTLGLGRQFSSVSNNNHPPIRHLYASYLCLRVYVQQKQ